MPKPTFKNYLSEFKSINGILAAIGVLVPAFSVFTNYSPPFFKGASLMTTAIAAIIIIVTFYFDPSSPKKQTRLPLLVRLSLKVFVIFLALLLVYLILFDLCTVETPDGTVRFQIGVGKYDWGLTNKGLEVKAKFPDKTPQFWMMSAALFRPGGPDVLWKTWTIYLSGVTIILVFVLIFVLWTFGWALLAKQKLKER